MNKKEAHTGGEPDWLCCPQSSQQLPLFNTNLVPTELPKPNILYYYTVEGLKWKDYLESGLWELSADSFWTFPHVYSEMCSADPPLYSTLAEAKLVIFKGDLNYRKLVGDRNWETTVPFRTALQVIWSLNLKLFTAPLEEGRGQKIFQRKLKDVENSLKMLMFNM